MLSSQTLLLLPNKCELNPFPNRYVDEMFLEFSFFGGFLFLRISRLSAVKIHFSPHFFSNIHIGNVRVHRRENHRFIHNAHNFHNATVYEIFKME